MSRRQLAGVELSATTHEGDRLLQVQEFTASGPRSDVWTVDALAGRQTEMSVPLTHRGVRKEPRAVTDMLLSVHNTSSPSRRSSNLRMMRPLGAFVLAAAFACGVPPPGGGPAAQPDAGWNVVYDSGTELTAIWGSGPSDVWAVGGRFTSGFMRHWDGSAWEPVGGGPEPLYGIWGTGPDDIWAVGSTGQIRHRTVAGWASVPSGTTKTLTGVWGTSDSDVWATGFDGILSHWAGTSWSASDGGVGAIDFNGVWGSAANDVWVVGDNGTILRWDGSVWSSVPSGTTRELSGIWGAGPNDVWAVGVSGTVLHWNGRAWDIVDAGAGSTRFVSVWGTGQYDVWAVGFVGRIYRWDGAKWTQELAPTSHDLYGMWGSGPNDVWAVGALLNPGSGVILHRP